MTILTKLIYRFSTISIKNPTTSIADMNKLIVKCIWKCRGPRIDTTVLQKKDKVGELTLLNFKTFYEAIASKQHDIGIKIGF